MLEIGLTNDACLPVGTSSVMGRVILINPESTDAGFGKMHGCSATYTTHADHNDIPYCQGTAHSLVKFTCVFEFG
jgi:hypothetical protein